MGERHGEHPVDVVEDVVDVAVARGRVRLAQVVSVVPTIQWVPHGMTKSTDLAVRRMIPVSE